MGQVLFAANLVAELEWELEHEGTKRELVLSPVAGISWRVLPRFSFGAEIRNQNEIVESDWEHSALHAGPVVSYRGNGWWVTATFLAQLPALKAGHGSGNLLLDDHERFELRVLLLPGQL